MRALRFGLVALALVAACGDEPAAWLRVIHLSGNTTAIDVGFDGERRVRALSLGQSSGYRQTSVGTLRLRVVPSEGSTAIAETELEVEDRESRTLFLVDNGISAAVVVAQDERTATSKGARLRLVNAISDAGKVELATGNGTLLSDVEPGTASLYTTVSEAKPALLLSDSLDSPLISLKALDLDATEAHTLVVFGSSSDNDRPLVARLFSDSKDEDPGLDPELEDAQLMVLHASPGADRVGVLVDGKELTSKLIGYMEDTGYLKVPAGRRTVALQVATGASTFYEQKLPFKSATRYTMAIADVPQQIKVLFLEDRFPSLPAGRAALRLLHLAPDEPAVDVKVQGDVANAFSVIAFSSASSFVPIPVGTHVFEINGSASGTAVISTSGLPLVEGRIYSLVLHGTQQTGVAVDILLNRP